MESSLGGTHDIFPLNHLPFTDLQVLIARLKHSRSHCCLPCHFGLLGPVASFRRTSMIINIPNASKCTECICMYGLIYLQTVDETRPFFHGECKIYNISRPWSIWVCMAMGVDWVGHGFCLAWRKPKQPKLHEISLRKRESSHEFVSLKITLFFLSFKSESLQPGKCHFSMSPHKTCVFLGKCLVWETLVESKSPSCETREKTHQIMTRFVLGGGLDIFCQEFLELCYMLVNIWSIIKLTIRNGTCPDSIQEKMAPKEHRLSLPYPVLQVGS